MSLNDNLSLRSRQKATLGRMLHLNKDGAVDLTLASQSEELTWKVLILDSRSQAIVSSVLRVNDLLRCGVTIHSLINSKRSPLPDVPAVYFVEPTAENVRHIIDDLTADKYESFYINFTSTINRELLEEFAKKVALSGKSSKILQVYDQYLDFIVTEPDLFSLDIQDVYTKFNNPLTNEDEIHQLADTIANGILATIITLGNIPVIRCSRGGPAELVASQLDLKLRDYVNNSKNSSFNTSIQQRPVLVLLDRSLDLASMFSHSWIYQCMVSDVLDLRRNTIKVIKFTDNDSNNSTPNTTTKQYDIDPNDFFWAKNSQLPFPDVVENADADLNTYKRDAQELSTKTGISSFNDIDPNAPDADTANIQQAVDALPELTARKSTLDMHMDVLATLLKELEAKSLDKFFEIEQNYNDPKIQSQFLAILNSESKRDNSTDKLRTFLILTLLTDLPAQFSEECETLLSKKNSETAMNALKYIRKFKEIMKLSNIPLNEASTTVHDSHATKNNSALFNGLSSKLYGLTEGRITEGLSSLASGLKNLLPDKKQLPITNVVEAIMDPTNASNSSVQLTDDYLYLDPKSRGGHSKPPKRQTYQESLVFIVGGGNYLEYSNLQEWANTPNKPNKHVTYGSTGILTAADFLSQCGSLGRLES
ncbi:protein Sly1p [[Candida] anglica]